MKRKLTPIQVQDSIAELTDDVTELKDGRQETKAWQEGAEKRFATIMEVLDHAAETVSQTAVNQGLHEQQSNERLARLETTVQKLSETVDRYLNARLNGSSQN